MFREFYKERDVVREERRMRVESSTQGKLMELLMATSFMAHPYRNMIGWASEIEQLARQGRGSVLSEILRARQHHDGGGRRCEASRYPAVGRKILRSDPGASPAAAGFHGGTQQEGEKRAVLETDSQPFLLMGYKRPNQTHPDDPVFDVIAGILSSGRTGLLYKDLVRDKRIALGGSGRRHVPIRKIRQPVRAVRPAAGGAYDRGERESHP